MIAVSKKKAARGVPRSVFAFLSVVFGTAGFLGALLGAPDSIGPDWISCLLGSGLIVFLVQIFVSRWSISNIESRLADVKVSDLKSKELLIFAFQNTATLRIGAATALTVITTLILFTSLLELGSEVLSKSAIWILLSQGVFMFPVFATMKRGALYLGEMHSSSQYDLKESAVLRSILVASVVAACIAGFALYISSDKVVEQAFARWMEDGIINGQAESAGMMSSSPSKDFLFALLVVASALLVSTLVSIRQGASLGSEFGFILERAEAFPKRIPVFNKGTLSKELAFLNQTLEQLEKRFYEMKRSDSDAIESGTNAREMKAEFFAGMSHDLRSPLNSVIGFTDLLIKGMEGPLTDAQMTRVGIISAEAKKLMILISDILDTSKLEAGRFEIERKWVPAVEVLTEWTSETESLIGSRPIVLKTFIVPGLPPVYVDKTRLCQALLSLTSKVIDVMPSGTITMKATLERDVGSDKQFFRVDLVDTARGVSKSDRKRFTEACLASEQIMTTSKAGSLGLGIALAKEILHLHGGQLEVLVSNRGESIFALVLPLDKGN